MRRWFYATLSSRLYKSIPDTGVLWKDNVAVCVLVLGIWGHRVPAELADREWVQAGVPAADGASHGWKKGRGVFDLI